jgi:hypothetical protein
MCYHRGLRWTSGGGNSSPDGRNGRIQRVAPSTIYFEYDVSNILIRSHSMLCHSHCTKIRTRRWYRQTLLDGSPFRIRARRSLYVVATIAHTATIRIPEAANETTHAIPYPSIPERLPDALCTHCCCRFHDESTQQSTARTFWTCICGV